MKDIKGYDNFIEQERIKYDPAEKRTIECDRCYGEGEISIYYIEEKRRHYETCPVCEGTGRIEK